MLLLGGCFTRCCGHIQVWSSSRGDGHAASEPSWLLTSSQPLVLRGGANSAAHVSSLLPCLGASESGVCLDERSVINPP